MSKHLPSLISDISPSRFTFSNYMLRKCLYLSVQYNFITVIIVFLAIIFFIFNNTKVGQGKVSYNFIRIIFNIIEKYCVVKVKFSDNEGKV